MRLAMFNENPGTCILMRRGGSAMALEPLSFFLCFGSGCPLEWIRQICLCGVQRSASHKYCRTEPMPSVSPTEIRCWNIHRMPVFFFPLKKKKDDLQFSKQSRLCVWFKFFISVILCEFHTIGRECGGEEGVVFGLRFLRGECEWRDVFSFIWN